jgi:ubiquinone/menaquinone biosynthesis C-methylase UbiE
MEDKRFNPEKRHRLDNPERRKNFPPERLLDKMNIRKGDTLLEIGAGTGYFSVTAADYVGDAGKVIASDISELMLADIKKQIDGKGISNIELVKCREDNIPVPEGTVDIILMAGVFHEIDDQIAYIEHIRTLLKDNGTVTILEWDKVKTERGPRLSHRIAPETLRDMFEYAGFSTIMIEKLDNGQYIAIFTKN